MRVSAKEVFDMGVVRDVNRGTAPRQSSLDCGNRYADCGIDIPVQVDSSCCGSAIYLTMNTGVLPVSVNRPANTLVIDVTAMTADLDLSGWVASGLVDGAIVSLRKLDHSPHRIIVTDDQGVIYQFVDKYSEVISFVFVKSRNFLRII